MSERLRAHVNYKICLKAAAMHEFFVFMVDFEVFNSSSYKKKCLNFHGLSERQKIGQHFPTQVGLHVQNIATHILQV